MSSPQLPLGLPPPAEQRLADFVGAEGLVELVQAVALQQRPDWPLLIGPSGSGKTHLLLGACAAAAAAGLPLGFVHLSGGEPADLGRIGAAVDSGLVCVDDLQLAAGNAEVELALFHLHNRCRAAGGRVIYASSMALAALPLQLPDLRSRLGQCTLLPLQPLDETARRTLLRNRAERRGLQLDDAVLDYLFRRYSRDLGALQQLLDRLDRESLAAQRRVTVPFLRQLLAEMAAGG